MEIKNLLPKNNTKRDDDVFFGTRFNKNKT